MMTQSTSCNEAPSFAELSTVSDALTVRRTKGNYQVASSFEQKFVDEMHKEFPYDEITLRNSNPRLFRFNWGRVSFQMSIEKSATRDLELRIICNKGAVDHLWRCSYTVQVCYTVNGVRPSEVFLARLSQIERSFGPDFLTPAEADRPGRAALLAEMDRDFDRRREPKPSSIEGFTPARGLLLADRYRLSALCTSIIMELRYNDESLTAFYDSDEHAELSEELLAVIYSVCERDRTHQRGHRAAPVAASIPDVDPDSPSARLAAIKHAAAAAATTRCSWSHFQTDVGRMLVAQPEYALTSAQLSTNFQEALLFLQSLNRREYAAEITPALRQLLHEIDILVARQEFQDALVNAVGTFIGRVDRLRSERAAAGEDVEMADTSQEGSDGVEWSQFVADVGTLREDAVFRENIRPTVLKETLDFLLHLEQEAFARIPSPDRSAMHGIIITLTRMMTRKHRSHGYVRDVLNVLVEMVDKLRSDIFM